MRFFKNKIYKVDWIGRLETPQFLRELSNNVRVNLFQINRYFIVNIFETVSGRNATFV